MRYGNMMFRFKNTVFFLFGLLVFMICITCRSEKEHYSEDQSDFELMQIDFLDKRIFLPRSYKKVNLNEVEEMIRQNPELGSTDRLFYDAIMQTDNEFGPPELFMESEDQLSAIVFTPGEYIPLGKELVSPYVNMLESNMLKSEFSPVRLESKFITLKNATAIKVKYEQHIPTGKRYLTQYIVTYGLKTFSIMVLNDENKDLRVVLNNFSE